MHFCETSQGREQGVRCDGCCSMQTVMMMNAQSIPHIVTEERAVSMSSDNDTVTITAHSLREGIKDMWLLFLLCTQIPTLKLTYLS